MSSSQANSDTRSGDAETEPGVSREAPPLTMINLFTYSFYSGAYGTDSGKRLDLNEIASILNGP